MIPDGYIFWLSQKVASGYQHREIVQSVCKISDRDALINDICIDIDFLCSVYVTLYHTDPV